MKSKILAIAVVAALSGLATSQAAMIGLSFRTSFGGSGSQTLGASDSAGVVAQTNWNNSALLSTGTATPTGNLLNLIDDSGAATTVDMAYNITGGGGYRATTGTYTGVGDKIMMNGFYYAPSPSLTFSQIAYSTYDVYVYILPDSAATTTTSVTLGSTTYYGRSPTPASFMATPVFTQALGASSGTATTGATYWKFSGVTGTSFSLSSGAVLTSNGTSVNAVINGVQIVAVPEPATWALLALSLTAVTILRRRRRA